MSRTPRVLPVILLALALCRLPAQEPAGQGRSGPVDLPPGCTSGANDLNVPAGHVISFHAYALGVQIYRWNGVTWAFVAPRAMLFASPFFAGPVGIHYAGPTWEGNDGSKVVATLAALPCIADPAAIAWLRLAAVSTSGSGLFEDTTHIQRVKTVGGVAPAAPGMFIGQQMEVPYTAEYYFYRAQQ